MSQTPRKHAAGPAPPTAANAVPAPVAAAAATAAASNNKLRQLLKKQQRPQSAAPSAQTPAASTPAAAPVHVSGQKRPRDEAPAVAKPVSAASTLASKLEAHSKHSQQQKKQKLAAAAAAARPAAAVPAPSSTSAAAQPRKLSALQQKMASKLAGARFRWLNEKLYTCNSSEAWEYFQAHPEEFAEYHRGFGVQVQEWPENPLDACISFVRQRGPQMVVGDFGCGEARLAASVPNKVHSFDLVAANPAVVACNIAHVPLAPNSLDIAIFCLSLMGVDFIAFIREAHRTLKQGGTLLIHEVRSRFEEAGLDVFVRAVKSEGFGLRRQEAKANTMFATFEFVKNSGAGAAKGKAAQEDGDEEQEEQEADDDEEQEEAQTQQQHQRKQGGGKQGGKQGSKQQQGGSSHARNKAKGKGQPAAAGDHKGSGSQKKGGAGGGKGFSHPVKKKGGASADGAPAPMLTACIYKKR